MAPVLTRHSSIPKPCVKTLDGVFTLELEDEELERRRARLSLTCQLFDSRSGRIRTPVVCHLD